MISEKETGVKLNCFDLFCGAGGSSHGAASAGFRVAGGIDRWALATRAFAANFQGAKTFTAPIENLSPRAVALELPRIDLLLASPECTNYSVAKGSKPRDELSKLSAFSIIEFAAELRPRWLIIENVIQMRRWDHYASFLQELSGLGYYFTDLTLDASEYGVPQRRRRLFIIADRLAPVPQRISRRPGRRPAVKSVLDLNGRWRERVFDPSRYAKRTTERFERAVRALGRDQDFLMVYYGSDGAGGFQRLDDPLRTVTTLDRFALVRSYGDYHTIRMLQVPELQRAMGFPMDHHLAGHSRRDQIKLLGNAVCPPVMTSILRELRAGSAG